MMQCKHAISKNSNVDISKIDKCWNQRKGISQSSNYSSHSSPNTHIFDSCLGNDEDNYVFFHINNNNKTEPGCIFDEHLVNLDQSDDAVEMIDNF